MFIYVATFLRGFCFATIGYLPSSHMNSDFIGEPENIKTIGPTKEKQLQKT